MGTRTGLIGLLEALMGEGGACELDIVDLLVLYSFC